MLKRRSHDLQGKVAVVTGAASGIGLASVQALSAEGVHTVLAGRQQQALDDALKRCTRGPGKAIAVAADLRHQEDATMLSSRAINAFGHLDVWINNAAVTAFGDFDEVPPEVFRAVVETNFFGYVHGMRAALKVFRRQSYGTIINVNSGIVFMLQPRTASYVASKHAVRGLSDVVRMELKLAGLPDIKVCSLYPAAVDTPIFQSGANYSGRSVKPLSPVHSAHKVARSVVSLVRRPRREATVGVPRLLLLLLEAVAPALAQRSFARYIARHHFTDAPAARSDGNVFVPTARQARISGGWRK